MKFNADSNEGFSEHKKKKKKANKWHKQVTVTQYNNPKRLQATARVADMLAVSSSRRWLWLLSC